VSGSVLGALRRSDLFAELSAEDLAGIAAGGERVTVPAGRLLFAEGSEPDAMYVVLDGALEVLKREGDGEVLLNTCGPGEPIGELSLVHGRPRSATVRATEDSVLMRVPAASFGDLLCQPTTARALLSTVVLRLEQQQILMRQQAKMAALGRLAAGLLHETNNPAAAVRRGVARLQALIGDLGEALTDLGSDGTFVLAKLGPDVQERAGNVQPLDALTRSDCAAELEPWLEDLGIVESGMLALSLVDLGFDRVGLEALLVSLPANRRGAAVRWAALYGEALIVIAEANLGAARVSETVGAVKAYAHTDEAPVQHVRVTDGLEQALALVRHKIPPAVEVVRDYAPDLPEVEAFPADLNSVWSNLLDNALDALDGEGKVTLRAFPDGHGVTVEVVDTGPGVPPEILDRIFDPFFTTKPVGKGSGLGLATAYGIVVNRHRGRLWVEPTPGNNRFVVTLPVSLRREH
jgi:signal transduction histidine kinase